MEMSYNILIADDSSTMRKIIFRTVKMAELPVRFTLFAENGSEAWEMLQRERIDLLFLDLNMPEMDGFALLEKMKGDESLRELPVIVVSAEGCAQKVDKLRDEKNVVFIKKPFAPRMIKSAFEELLRV
ncbi:MAG: response regulator [Actinobacteria bacterium]|nr:response regulator [Actinomycetota bacterium]